MFKVGRKVSLCFAFLVLAIAASAVAAPGSVTIATFADPSVGSVEPLFTVDYNQGTLQGGWSGFGLTLEVPVTGDIYEDATFIMDNMTFDGSGGYTTSGPAAIRFSNNADEEVLRIDFDRLWIQDRNSGLNAQNDVYFDNVIITGAGIENLSMEEFGFTFTNIVEDEGVVTASASFTSSAVPEPATMFLLGIGGLLLRKRK